MAGSYQIGTTGVTDTAVVYTGDGAPVIEETRIEVVVTEGRDLGKTLLLPPDGLVLGTHPESVFRLRDKAVSRRHVELVPVPGGVKVRDLGSTNGTLVGGCKIAEAVVPVGSTLVVGETRVDLRATVERFPLPLSRRRRFGELIGSSSAMRQVYALLERACEVDATVLIEGETGTGKELAARAVHSHSARAKAAFHVVDCGAIPPTLIESELFGHVRGAFTGADRDRSGAFELADGGTLFFDEVGELPLSLQPKLLRALESRAVRRVGSADPVAVNVRFVAATNRSLEAEVRHGRFREDLYYRLNVFKIVMPPLRDHRDDIPLLVRHFLAPQGASPLPDELLTRLGQLDWRGNVRELRNAVERAVILDRGGYAAALADGDDEDEEADAGGGRERSVDASRPFKEAKNDLVVAFERAYIEQVLARTGGNVSAAARESGIDRKHLERLIRRHGIEAKTRS
jgi:DNA-binding NtrC family response regulator